MLEPASWVLNVGRFARKHFCFSLCSSAVVVPGRRWATYGRFAGQWPATGFPQLPATQIQFLSRVNPFGRGAGPDPVPAGALSGACGGLRRRRPPQPDLQRARRDRLHRQLPGTWAGAAASRGCRRCGCPPTCRGIRRMAVQHPRSKWAAWGVTLPNGRPLPTDPLPASLLLPMGRHGPAFLAYQNFQVYLQWNNSLIYCITVAYLGTRLDGAPPVSAATGRFRSCRSMTSRSCSTCGPARL